MKKFIAFVAILLTTSIVTTHLYAQSKAEKRSERKTQRDAERARQKAAEQAADVISYDEAVKAVERKQFVLEADQVQFRNGNTAYVTSNTNFVLVNLERGTVQVAFNTAQPGPNGIGGVTVDGSISGLKTESDKKGNVRVRFNIQGVGISAQVFLVLYNGSNRASVDISPNFNSQTLTLNGQLVPLEQSSIYKGRSW